MCIYKENTVVKKMKFKHRIILHVCQLLSLCVHLLVILAIHKHPLSYKKKQSLEKESFSKHFLKTDEILKDAFTNIQIKDHQRNLAPTDESFQEDSLLFTSIDNNLQEKAPPLFHSEIIDKVDFFSAKQLLILEENVLDSEFTPLLDSSKPLNLGEYVKKITIQPTAVEKTTPSESKEFLTYEDSDTFVPKDFLPQLSFEEQPITDKIPEGIPSHLYDDLAVYPDLEPLPAVDLQTAHSSFPTLPTLGELETRTRSEDFDVDLILFNEKTEDGYLFAITLIPKSHAQFEKLKQNVIFILDKSNAIQKDRLKTSMNAIISSIGMLGPEDTFNILAFDTKLERLSIENLYPTKGNKYHAKNFLNGLRLGSIFSSADPYKPLNNLLYEHTNDDEVSTIILVTNGEGLANKNAQPYFIQEFTMKNANKFYLYALAMQSDHNLPLLEAITQFNRGKLLTSPTRGGLKRKLMRIVKSIHYPIAKDLSLTAISKTTNNKVSLFPSSYRLPALYMNEPFVILGSTQNLDDFVLFVQGKHKDKWLNIKKNISFLQAKKAEQFLHEEWALQKSFDCYEKYFREKDPKYLNDAESILESFHVPPIFR